jgi:hypothetical protein
MGGSKTDNKTFTSPDKRIRLTIPIDWEQYDDGVENTFAFFNAKYWTGNFRLTPFYWTEPTDSQANKALEFIMEELDKNPSAEKLSIGNYQCAHYKENLTYDNEQLVIYYWAVGVDNNTFMCSFTIDQNQENTDQNLAELQTIKNIIQSIKIM